MRSTRLTIAGLALALPLSLAACGADSSATGDTMTSSSAPSTTPSETMTTEATAGENFGPGCAAVPADGKGSFQGMATDPVATAASNNPVLSTLVAAVKKATLVDTLNSADGITVFAPTNDAFDALDALDAKTLDAAMADPKGLLTKVLTNHVVSGQLSPDELDGEHETLAGTTIMVSGSGEDFTVDGSAKVICGNVKTANATVYIIDGVLLPQS